MKIRKFIQPPQISTASQSDIAFLLLIFLMVVSALDQSRDLKIKVPKASNVEQVSQDQVFAVFVDADGQLFYKGKEMDLNTLYMRFLNHRRLFPNPIVQIVADQNVAYEEVYRVVEFLRKKQPLRVAYICRVDKGGKP